MKWTLLPTLALLTLLLTACPAAETPGPGPNPDPGQPTPGQTVTQVGVVTFSEIGGAGLSEPFRSGNGSFFSISETPASSYNNAGTTDVCFVAQDSPTNEPPTEEPEPIQSLDAGAQITAAAGAETYAVLEKNEAAGNIFYSSNDAQNLPPLPTSTLTVTVPGAAFPAFTADAPAAGAALEFSSPADLTNITPASTFSWTSTPAAGTYLILVIYQQLGGENRVDVSCVLQDDGSFSFSPETRAEMQANGFTSGALLSGTRTSSRVEVRGDAALILNVSKSISYGSAQSLTEAQVAGLQLELQRLQNRISEVFPSLNTAL